MENKSTELKKVLNEYKELTSKLISTLESEEYTLLGKLLEDRQKIIDAASLISYNAEEFSSICSELKILQTEKRLHDLMAHKKGTIRAELDRLASMKNANKGYRKKSQVDSIFFNKKI